MVISFACSCDAPLFCVSAPPSLSCHNGYANGVMLMVVMVLHWMCVYFVSCATLYHLYDPCHGSCVYPALSCVFLCVCSHVCTLPALLLNNSSYHVVLSDDRNGLRPLVGPGTTQAQEKSFNVPQGKRPQTGRTESGWTPASLPVSPGLGHSIDVVYLHVSDLHHPTQYSHNHRHPLSMTWFVWSDGLV